MLYVRKLLQQVFFRSFCSFFPTFFPLSELIKAMSFMFEPVLLRFANVMDFMNPFPSQQYYK